MSAGGGTGVTTIPSYVSQYHSLWMGDVGVSVNAAGEADDADTDATAIATAVNLNEAGETVSSINLAKALNTAKELNPYTDVSAYSPDPIFVEINAECLKFLDLVADIDPEDWMQTATEIATDQARTIFDDSDVIAGAVTAFDLRTQDAYLRSAARSHSGMLGARAVMTGMWDNQVAYMENQRRAEVNAYSADIGLRKHDQRVAYIQSTAQNYIQMVGTQLESQRAAVELRMKVGAAQIVAKNDQITADMALDKNEVLWVCDLFPSHVAGMLSAYTGGVPSSREPSVGDKALAALFGAGQLLVGAAPLLAKL